MPKHSRFFLLLLLAFVATPIFAASTSFTLADAFSSDVSPTTLAVTGVTFKSSISATADISKLKTGFTMGMELILDVGNYEYRTTLGETGAKFVSGKSQTTKRTIDGGTEMVTVSYSTKSLSIKVSRVSSKNATIGEAIIADTFLDSEQGITQQIPATISFGGIFAKYTLQISGKPPTSKAGKAGSGQTSSISIQGKSMTGTVAALTTADVVQGVSVGGHVATFVPDPLPSTTNVPAITILGSTQLVRGGSLTLQVLAPPSDGFLIGSRSLPGYFSANLNSPVTSSRAEETEHNCPACKIARALKTTRTAAPYPAVAGRDTTQMYTLVVNSSTGDFYDALNLIVVSQLGGVTNGSSEFDATVNTTAAASSKLQISLNWVDPIDMDLHVTPPDGNDIYYGNRVGQNSGTLDLDSNPACSIDGINNENITWSNTAPPSGHFIVRLDIYSACSLPGPFSSVITVNNNGVITSYPHTSLATDADSGSAGSGQIIAQFDRFLALGEKVPNEREVFASGPIVAPVKRGTPQFAALVMNNNPNVVFVTGTKEDDRMHLMTQKCSDHVDALAALVSTTFPGDQLRITAAYDDTNSHGASSLHYEGRAVDITLASKDSSKLGQLAFLAVQVGFDWVYYEDTLHVHASVAK